MAKIGILTFHKSINTGAFIQCYALCTQLLKDFPECQIEVIDYATRRVYINYSYHIIDYFFGDLFFKEKKLNKTSPLKLFCSKLYHLLRDPYLLKRKKKEAYLFKCDWKHLPLSDYSYISDDYKQFFSDIQGMYDIVIVGSDCVWQYAHYPFPNAYFLHDNIGSIKMSYAACAYEMRVSDLKETQLNYIREALNTYDYLGIRDAQTDKILQNLQIHKTWEHNCDPTFLLNLDELPVSLDKIKEKLMNYGVCFNKKIIGVQLSNWRIGQIISKLFGSEYQLVAIRGKNPYVNCFIDDLSPLEWSRVFALFDCTITDYFHGTILSLLNGTYTVSLDNTKGFLSCEESRLKDLLKRLDLMHYYIELPNNSVDDINENEVRSKVQMILSRTNKNEIVAKIEKEAQFYQPFKKKLRDIVDDLNKGKMYN